jgi:hypothetical protein
MKACNAQAADKKGDARKAFMSPCLTGGTAMPMTQQEKMKKCNTDAAGILAGLLVVAALQGCSISPTQQDAIRRAWEARDAERARECQRAGRGFVAGSCTGGGGP